MLLFSITTPTYILLLASRLTASEYQTADLVFSRGLMGLVLLAFFADQQQWREYCTRLAVRGPKLKCRIPDYQNAKKEYQKTAKVPPRFQQEDLDRGFIVTGLWSWSRHPNFAAEQSVWVVLYQWSCWVTDVYFNWTIVGALSYLILFQASTWFTELISAKKYPEYAEYQKRVGKFLPRLGTDLPGDFRDKQGSKSNGKRLSR